MKDKSKFFGVLHKEVLENLSEKEQLRILVDKKFFSIAQSFQASSNDINENGMFDKMIHTFTIIPDANLVNEFYGYVMSVHQSKINLDFQFFFKEFDEEVFAMEFQDQKRIGLKHFKEILSNVLPKGLDFAYQSISKNEIESMQRMNRIQMLKGTREGIKSTIATTENLIQYITGQVSYFICESFKSQLNFESLIEFESQLKIILSLNDKFQFEEDTYFSRLGVLKDKYQNYTNLFINFELFVWVGDKIKNFTIDKPSHIESLYQSLLDLDLVSGTKKLFMDYVNNEHQMKLKKIRSYSEKNNRKHDFRVIKFRDELKELTLKK